VKIETKVLKLLKTEKSSSQIKLETGVSATKLTIISKKYGISLVERNRLLREGKSPKVLFRSDKKIKKKVINQIKKGKSRPKIADKYGITVYKVKVIAQENNLTIPRPQKRDKKRHKEILNILKSGALTYDEIGEKFGITKQRVSQIAKFNGYSRWGQIRENKAKFVKKIKKDIKKGLSYNDIYEKHNLKEKRDLLNDTDLSSLFTDMMATRNEAIKKQYRTKTAKKVMKLKDYELNNPNTINDINTVYRVSSKLGYKKYPMIGNRSAGGVFEDKKILKYIERKKDKDGWSFPMITYKLNRMGRKTLTGKEFTTPNVIAKYHAYKKNKYKRVKLK
jgi:DNA-binding CsgD family transcriptional regulator/uncharacterized protein YerC